MNKWIIISIIAIIIIVVIVVIAMNMKSSEDQTAETNTQNTTESFTPTEEIVVPVHIDSINPQYNNNTTNLNTQTVNGTLQNIPNTMPNRGEINFSTENYPPNPDLYPENGQEFRPDNSMYTHLENNFLDIGPQIGVGTRVNSQRNGPQLLFRKQYAVPTIPTGYWNQSTISQPIFTNNDC